MGLLGALLFAVAVVAISVAIVWHALTHARYTPPMPPHPAVTADVQVGDCFVVDGVVLEVVVQ